MIGCPDCERLVSGNCGKHYPGSMARERGALARLVGCVAAAEAMSHAEDVDLEGPARVAYQNAIGKIFDAYRVWRRA